MRPHLLRLLAAVAMALSTAGAWAQSQPKSLNLKLPPASALPPQPAAPARPGSPAAPAAPASTRAIGASSHVVADTQAAYAADPPGTFYGDTSGHLGNVDADVPRCDDATYNQPQLHGSVGTGVVAGSHFGGNYQGADVNLSQAFGSCDHPTGGVSISIGGTQGHFHGR